MWTYFWVLYSISFIYLSLLSVIPHCLDYYSSIVNLEVGWCQSSNFVLLLQYSGAFASPYKLYNQFVDIYKITCWILIGIARIYRSSWEELIFWQYWVFLSINMDFLLLFSCQVVSDSVPAWTAAPQVSLSFTISQFAQVHVHWISDAIQPSHPLLPSSPSAFNLSQHQDLFQRVSSSHQVVKVPELQLQH